MQLLEMGSAVSESRSTVKRRTRVAILGGGPAGLGAAWQLAKQQKADVVVIEQRDDVGGNAGSFELDGLSVDYGSHRLHPACKPRILEDLRHLLKDDLLDRPRHGRIRLRQRWIHFPLKPFDLLRNLPLSFASGVAMDSLKKFVPHSNGLKAETFTSVLVRGLGSTVCNDFYFPYAEKIWGLAPAEISATQARRRVSAGSLGKMARKVFSLMPGMRAPGAGRFFYPREGYGQISRSIATEAGALGADLRLRTTVRTIHLGTPHRIEVERDGEPQSIEADLIWSTIPLTILSRIVNPAPPPDVLDAGHQISYRAMILVYLVLEQSQWTPFDAHYFPEADVKLTRLSEPKNYSASTGPANRTVLCGELPCELNDDTWRSSDDELAKVVRDSLAACGLAIRAPILRVVTKRLAFAYPIYRQGYEKYFVKLDEWASNVVGLLTFGRQGLFAHDNTHHALAMAYAAVDCLSESGEFDSARWRDYRAEFANHVVED